MSFPEAGGPVQSDVPPGYRRTRRLPAISCPVVFPDSGGAWRPRRRRRPPSSRIPAQQVLDRLNVWKDELIAWFKTLASAAVYATLIVTFGFQVARVEGQSMAPTLADQDRLIVNKFAYRIGIPRRGDIVMLYYPINPDKSFVKRVIAEEGDTVRIVDGRVYVNDVPMDDSFVPPGVPQPRRLRPRGRERGLLLRHGRPPEQQLRQPPLGPRAEEVHHRQGPAALVAAATCSRVLTQVAGLSMQNAKLKNANTVCLHHGAQVGTTSPRFRLGQRPFAF